MSKSLKDMSVRCCMLPAVSLVVTSRGHYFGSTFYEIGMRLGWSANDVPNLT